MKKQLDEEKRKKEELEDRLMEENMKRQQERMKAEYEAEQEKRRRKEEEQTRRREAQLKHMERLQQEAAEKKKVQRARTLAAADEAASSLPTSSRHNSRDARNFQNSNSQQDGKKRFANQDNDFGLNLKSDSRLLAARAPNKFFDAPTTPVKMPRTSDDRKRPKPLTPAVPVPQKGYNRRSQRPENTPGAVVDLPPVETTERPGHASRPDEPHSGHANTLEVQTTPPTREHTEIQTAKPQHSDMEIQTTPALNQWESERKHEEPRPPVVRGRPFDWKIHIQDMSEEEKARLEKMSEEETKHFAEENQDLMSQLSAMKVNLRSAGPGRQQGEDGKPNSTGKDTDSGIGGGSSPDKDKGGQNTLGSPTTIPAGSSDDVDYLRVVSGRPDDKNNPRRREPSYLDLNDSSGTTIRKFLEHTRARSKES
ncbi:stress response protein nst1-like isoform X2 [Penaeus monodon]|nr:stress response protein nst1-like isoform X2 [Penaeus monodon]